MKNSKYTLLAVIIIAMLSLKFAMLVTVPGMSIGSFDLDSALSRASSKELLLFWFGVFVLGLALLYNVVFKE